MLEDSGFKHVTIGPAVDTFGGAIGACILSIPAIGISSARWNTDWRFLIVGVILLLAVVSNKFLRNKAEGIRR